MIATTITKVHPHFRLDSTIRLFRRECMIYRENVVNKESALTNLAAHQIINTVLIGDAYHI